MAKQLISPGDVKNMRLALSDLQTAREWFQRAELFGVSLNEKFDQIAADERICNNVLASLEPIKGEVQ